MLKLAALFVSLLASFAVRGEVVLVVSADSPVSTLTAGQVSNIYLGRIVQLPGQDAVIPIDQRETTGLREKFYQEILGLNLSRVKAHWSKMLFTGRGRPPYQVSGDEEMKQIVSANPVAIGYIDKENLDNSVKPVFLAD